jgi:uncharacterized low-complexity protein
MKKLQTLTPIAAMLVLSMTGVVHAGDNAMAKAGEAQCGASKTEATHASCGAKKAEEAKCGAHKAEEAKCGAKKAESHEGKCGEAKCGAKK